MFCVFGFSIDKSQVMPQSLHQNFAGMFVAAFVATKMFTVVVTGVRLQCESHRAEHCDRHGFKRPVPKRRKCYARRWRQRPEPDEPQRNYRKDEGVFAQRPQEVQGMRERCLSNC